MTGYAIRRLLLIPPTLLVVMLMVFAMISFLPGDAVDAAGGRGAGGQSAEAKEAKRVALGLDRPLPVQLIAYLVGWPRTRGVVVVTRDGGQTWEPAEESAVHFFNAITLTDERHGWAVERKGGIFETKDSGVTWENRVPENQKALYGLAFPQPSTGWAVGADGTIYQTTDGGRTWNPQASGTSATLRAAAFVDVTTGVVVGDGGAVIRTADGGASWSAVSTGIAANLTAVAFADAQNGWVAGSDGTVLYTDDGGQTWARQETGSSAAINAVHFVSRQAGVAVGSGGTILVTRDGGTSWRAQASGSDADLFAVRLIDEQNIMVTGAGGLILASSDGGFNWTAREANPLRPVTQDLRYASFVNDQIGVASGWRSSWDWGLLGGDLGSSLLNGRTAVHELSNRIPRSLQLMAMSMIIAVGLGIPLGVFAAIRQDTWIDYVFRSLAVVGLSLPGFWFATLIILLPAVWWQWTPPLEFVSPTEDPLRNLQFFLLPALVVGFGTMAAIMRLTRAQMLEVMRQDYIRTAWSKGLRESTIVVRHALKNALIPVVTVIGIQIPFVLGETVVIEYIFRVPGIGLLAYDSITKRDYPLVQSVVLFLAFLYIFMNVVVDLAYGWLDPRIRYA